MVHWRSLSLLYIIHVRVAPEVAAPTGCGGGRMESDMNTQQWTIAAIAAAVVACGGAGLANAAGAHGTGGIVLAADSNNPNNTYQGVGGNGSARLKESPYNSGAGGNGAAKIDTGKTHSGVGGEARGNALKQPLNK